MPHSHCWTENVGGTEAMCGCGATKDLETGAVDTQRQIVWQDATPRSGVCTWCGKGITKDSTRAKVWETGMAKSKGKQGPGVYMHPGCAAAAVNDTSGKMLA